MLSRNYLLLGCAVLLAILALLFDVSFAQAQSVPATARQAAKLPQFASKLGHPTMSQSQQRRPQGDGACNKFVRMSRDGFLPQDDTLYDNGPINGTTDAWTINYGMVVSDSFTVVYDVTLTGMIFGAWLFPGDVLQNVEIRIGTSPYDGSVSDQVVNFSQSNCVGNQYGFNVCTESGTLGTSVDLAAGTYWVTLQNANVNTGDPIYWDENSGFSSAFESSVGTIPSEAFTLLGNAATTSTTYQQPVCIPEQDGAFNVIHDFTGSDGASPDGVTTDAAGNVYGTAVGMIYKLAQSSGDWLLTTLYNFAGGDGGSSPAGLFVGPHQNLYGSANSSDLSCSNYGASCGLIFSLRPYPSACPSALCPWNESVIYRFTSSTDAWGGHNLVADRDGNLCGVSGSGGAQQSGAVFELSPTLGGWTETILYSFTGGRSGGGPTELIVGTDGTLFGIAYGGLYGRGVIFQLTRGVAGWSESVIYDIPQSGIMYGPHALVQDGDGTLFAIYDFSPCCADEYSVIFSLTPLNGRWQYTELWRGDTQYTDSDIAVTMVGDGNGHVYGAGRGSVGGCMGGTTFGRIFGLYRSDNGRWAYTEFKNWGNTSFWPTGKMAIDPSGNVYGTEPYCGTHNYGTVWQLAR
jgi:hypothetical protein